MHLPKRKRKKKVSVQVSLRSPRRLTFAETFLLSINFLHIKESVCAINQSFVYKYGSFGCMLATCKV